MEMENIKFDLNQHKRDFHINNIRTVMVQQFDISSLSDNMIEIDKF